MDISYVFKSVEASSALSKKSSSPFRGVALGMEEKGCNESVGTLNEVGNSQPSTRPIIALTDLMSCNLSTNIRVIEVTKLNKDINLNINHGSNEDYSMELLHDNKTSPVHLRLKGKEVIAKVLSYGNFTVPVTIVYKDCLTCTIFITLNAPVPKRALFDSDGDGIADSVDIDGDGRPDIWDMDGDGRVDAVDSNGDGKPDWFDTNGDGIIDAVSTDNEGIPRLFDTNGDCIIDAWDSDGDGIPDAWDTNGDGKIDVAEHDENIGKALPKIPGNRGTIKGVIGGGGLCTDISGVGEGLEVDGQSPFSGIGLPIEPTEPNNDPIVTNFKFFLCDSSVPYDKLNLYFNGELLQTGCGEVLVEDQPNITGRYIEKDYWSTHVTYPLTYEGGRITLELGTMEALEQIDNFKPKSNRLNGFIQILTAEYNQNVSKINWVTDTEKYEGGLFGETRYRVNSFKSTSKRNYENYFKVKTSLSEDKKQLHIDLINNQRRG